MILMTCLNSASVTGEGGGGGGGGLTAEQAAQLALIPTIPASTTALVYSNPIEGSLHLKNILRALLAVAAGETDINTATNEVIFKSQDGLKERIKATSIAGERTGLTLDLS